MKLQTLVLAFPLALVLDEPLLDLAEGGPDEASLDGGLDNLFTIFNQVIH